MNSNYSLSTSSSRLAVPANGFRSSIVCAELNQSLLTFVLTEIWEIKGFVYKSETFVVVYLTHGFVVKCRAVFHHFSKIILPSCLSPFIEQIVSLIGKTSSRCTQELCPVSNGQDSERELIFLHPNYTTSPSLCDLDVSRALFRAERGQQLYPHRNQQLEHRVDYKLNTEES